MTEPKPTAALVPWLELSEGTPDRRRVFAVRSDVVQSQRTGKRWTVDRVLAPDWVNVVALTPDDDMLFVRQWRFGARAFTLELPAGLVEPGEDPLAAGLRELLEETGYAPEGAEARILGSAWPNPAFMGNRCSTIYVPRAVQVAAQALDPMEEIEIVRVPSGQVDALLQRGEVATALGLVGLLWWQKAR